MTATVWSTIRVVVAAWGAGCRGVRRNRESGQGIVEYGLILGGAAAVAVIALVFFSDQVAAVIDAIGTAVDRATT